MTANEKVLLNIIESVLEDSSKINAETLTEKLSENGVIAVESLTDKDCQEIQDLCFTKIWKKSLAGEMIREQLKSLAKRRTYTKKDI